MIFAIRFRWDIFGAAGFEGSLEERTSFDHPLGGCSPLLATWKIVHLTHVDPSLPKSDFFTTFKTGMGIMPSVLSHPQVREHLNESGELLPITFGGGDAYLFHFLVLLDALDRNLSNCRKMSTGDVICNSPVFRSSFRTQHWFFRIPENKVLYTTSEFISYYQEQGFTGLEFHPQRMSEA